MSDLQKSTPSSLGDPLQLGRQISGAIQDRYMAEISRKQPSAFVFLIDQSGSMQSAFDGQQSKAEVVAQTINSLLDTLITRCQKSEPEPRDYFDIALLGYGGASSEKANLLWEGDLAGRTWVTVSELKRNRQEDRVLEEKNVRGKVLQQEVVRPRWISPVANHLTPMCDAFQQAHALLQDWTAKHPRSYPPTVINISDGEQTDGSGTSLLQHAKALRDLHTLDGHLLLLNCHIGADAGAPVLFPKSAAELPQDDRYARLLYDLSSPMPEALNQAIANEIKNEDLLPNTSYIGMAYAQGSEGLLHVMDIGTRQTKRTQ
ncbi:MAG: hypothetical protein ACFCUI_11215 [Bernardetiaceae bacterium]